MPELQRTLHQASHLARGDWDEGGDDGVEGEGKDEDAREKRGGRESGSLDVGDGGEGLI